MLGKRTRHVRFQTVTKRKKRRYFRKGYNRTSGFYGRYRGRNPELKFFDTDVNVTAGALIAAGAIHASINLIPQNITESGRIGRKCVVKKIGWKWNIVKPTTANITLGHAIVRMICYKDKQCNGAAAVPSTNVGILASANYQSFRNLANTGRFTILYDKTFDLNVLASAGDGTANDSSSLSLSGEWYKDCNIPLEFDNTTGAITEIRSNNIGFLFISLNGVNTSVSIDSKVRIRFSDS